MYRWAPDLVWGLELFEALDYVDAALAHVAMSAGIHWAALLAPEALEGMMSGNDEPMTLAEQYGEDVAAEVAKLENRQREFLKRKRDTNHGR